jgi:hypothetical protein
VNVRRADIPQRVDEGDVLFRAAIRPDADDRDLDDAVAVDRREPGRLDVDDGKRRLA